jgi:hypothetical protein
VSSSTINPKPLVSLKNFTCPLLILIILISVKVRTYLSFAL